MIYLILADGFEDIEAIGTIDILRRCGLQVQTLSVTGKRVVTSARGLVIKADSLFRKNHLVHCEALILPGGLQGAISMSKNSVLKSGGTHRWCHMSSRGLRNRTRKLHNGSWACSHSFVRFCHSPTLSAKCRGSEQGRK